MPNLAYLDFDGTLIDSKKRLYQLFTDLVPESTFTYQEYWTIKRNRINQKELLQKYFNYTDDKVAKFKQMWLSLVEDEAYLRMDAPFDGVSAFLNAFSHQNFYLVTARQSEEKAIQQIKAFGWDNYFVDILVTKQKTTKYALVKGQTPCNSNAIFVGDTGEDVQTGKELGMRTVAVSSGFLCKEVLQEYKPDFIINSVVELNEVCPLS